MFSKILGFSLLTLAAAQNLPITVTTPSSAVWFVANSLNTISWTPCQGSITQEHALFNVVVKNADPSVLIGNLSVIGAVNTFDCSKSFTPTNLAAAPNYTMFLIDSTSAEVIAVSQEFEVMPQGSPYSTATASPAAGSPSATDGSAAPQQSGSSSGSGNSTGSGSTKNGAASFKFTVQTAIVGLAGVAAMAATLL